MIALIALLMASPTAAADASPVCRDGKTADQAVSAVYDLVSVPPGGAWDWDRIGDLFMGDGLFVTVMPRPAGSQTSKATLASLREQTEAAYRRSGFIEREYRRQSRVFGNIASIYSSFYIAIPPHDTRPLAKGLHHFQLVQADGCWRIASNISQMEGGGWRLPTAFAPTEGFEQ